jgi:hypothetical protein
MKNKNEEATFILFHKLYTNIVNEMESVHGKSSE